MVATGPVRVPGSLAFLQFRLLPSGSSHFRHILPSTSCRTRETVLLLAAVATTDYADSLSPANSANCCDLYKRALMTKRLCVVTIAVAAIALTALDARAEETIVFFRHAEKPSGGNGQLTCQGLNRSLALANVLVNRFGPADWGYAPNPAAKISDPAGSFFYVRPLATLEPAAIRSGISVNTNYAYNDIAGLQSILIRSSKASDTVYVAWEHDYLVRVVQSIMNAYGGGAAVPPWISGDYDALYIVHVTYNTSGIQAWFELGRQGLNGQPTTCP